MRRGARINAAFTRTLGSIAGMRRRRCLPARARHCCRRLRRLPLRGAADRRRDARGRDRGAGEAARSIRRLVPVEAGTLDRAGPGLRPPRPCGRCRPARWVDLRRHVTNDIVTVGACRLARLGPPPGGVHDAAAVTIGERAYLFGGGTGAPQIDRSFGSIRRTGAAAGGRPPAGGGSDQTAAAHRRNRLRRRRLHRARAGSTRSSPGAPGRARAVVAHLPLAAPLRGGCRRRRPARDRGRLASERLCERRRSSSYSPADGPRAPDRHACRGDDARGRGGDRRRSSYVIGGRGAVLGNADRPDRRASIGSTRTIASPGVLDVAALRSRARSPSAVAFSSPVDVARTGARSRRSASSGRARSRSQAGSPAFGRRARSERLRATTGAEQLDRRPRDCAKPLVYVPNSESNTVDVIDPHDLPGRRALRRRRACRSTSCPPGT